MISTFPLQAIISPKTKYKSKYRILSILPRSGDGFYYRPQRKAWGIWWNIGVFTYTGYNTLEEAVAVIDREIEGHPPIYPGGRS